MNKNLKIFGYLYTIYKIGKFGINNIVAKLYTTVQSFKFEF